MCLGTSYCSGRWSWERVLYTLGRCGVCVSFIFVMSVQEVSGA